MDIYIKIVIFYSAYAATSLQAASVTAVQSNLEQWVNARQLISKEKSDWLLEREFLAQSEILLTQELESIKEQIELLEQENASKDELRQKLLSEKSNSHEKNAVLKEEIVILERDVLELLAFLPDHLQNKLDRFIVRIPQNPDETQLSPGQRLQNVVAILSQTEKFDKAINAFGETRETADGKKIHVNTIYWGLSIAFYADKFGEISGIGIPRKNGWEWSQRDDYAQAITKLIAIYEGDTDAIEFVPLPVNIQK